MKIFLDSIIFSLQRSGGISVVYYELLKRLMIDKDIQLQILDYNNHNIFKAQLHLPSEMILKDNKLNCPIFMRRFMEPNLPDDNGIFHSSYYRITKNPNYLNITTVHDFTYEYFITGFPKIVHQIQKSKAIRNSRKLICVSQNTKEDLLKFYPKFNRDYIKVIHNGVDNLYQPLLNKDEAVLKQLVPFSSGEFVLYVGDRKSLYKNFNIAVNACKLSNQPLVMVGGGLLSEKENQLLNEKLGVNKFKHLNGLNNGQLNLIYNHAFCLLYPSLYEGFGIPILEAQRAGCPIISTNYSSIPEVAGKGAILLNNVTDFQIAEMIELIKNDLTFAADLRKEGFKNSLRFSWDKCYQQTKELYKEVHQEYF